MPGFNPMRKRDWERERVFTGYDPICDESPGYDAEFHGFAYPMEGHEPAEGCDCTQDPDEPATATLCDSCIYRLTAEAA